MNTESFWRKIEGEQYPHRKQGYQGPLCAHGGKAERCKLPTILGSSGENISSDDLLLVLPSEKEEERMHLVVKGESLNPRNEVTAYLFQSNSESSELKHPLPFSSLAELTQYLTDIGLPVPSQILEVRARVAAIMGNVESTTV